MLEVEGWRAIYGGGLCSMKTWMFFGKSTACKITPLPRGVGSSGSCFGNQGENGPNAPHRYSGVAARNNSGPHRASKQPITFSCHRRKILPAILRLMACRMPVFNSSHFLKHRHLPNRQQPPSGPQRMTYQLCPMMNKRVPRLTCWQVRF